jgi:hypothetical protein
MIHGYQHYSDNCIRTVVKWDSCWKDTNIEMQTACNSCANITEALWFTAFMACASLILSLLGAQTRVRKKADVPVQKLLGMFAEVNGVFTLSLAISLFESGCFKHLRHIFRFNDLTSSFWLGPGYYCYIFCIISGGVRAVVHWLTPLPGKGKGFKVILTEISPLVYSSLIENKIGNKAKEANSDSPVDLLEEESKYDNQNSKSDISDSVFNPMLKSSSSVSVKLKQMKRRERENSDDKQFDLIPI